MENNESKPKISKERRAQIARENGKRGGRPTNKYVVREALMIDGKDYDEIAMLWKGFSLGYPEPVMIVRDAVKRYRKWQSDIKPILSHRKTKIKPSQNKP